MRDAQKTRKQLLTELQETRRQLELLAAAEVERKAAGEELKQSEEKFYKAFLSSPDMIIITSLKDGKYIEVNDNFVNNTGYSREEFIGHTVDEFDLWANPEDMEKMTRLLQENGRFKGEEYTFRVKSGELRCWLCSAEIITIAGEACMIAVAVDITRRKKMEQALRESEQKLAIAFHSGPQAFIITTVEDGRVIDVNESFCRVSGFTRDELIDRESPLLGTWRKHGDRESVIAAIREKGRVVNKELQFRDKRGMLHTALYSAEIIDIGGKECLISSATDVTDRNYIEQALRESEEKFSKAFASSPNAICITTVAESRFIEVNESFMRFTGYSRDEILGRTSQDLHLWVDESDARKMAEPLERTGKLYNVEIRSRSKSGEIRTGLFSADTIEIQGKRNMILVITDITEQKKAEQALKESEEKFAKAFRTSPLVITVTRLSDGTYLEANDSFTKVFGFTREEAIGRRSLDMNVWIKPEDRFNVVRQLHKQGRIINEVIYFRTKAGDTRICLFSAELIEYGAEPCLLGVTNDITEYKKMEEKALEAENLREVDRLRTEVLANVSHELRTPLASIKGFATMLMDYGKRLSAAEKQEYLDTIDKNADRLVELIEQLLEMSRLGVGMLSIRKTPTDVVWLCKDIIAQARIRSKDYRFSINLPPKLPKVNMDENRIRQVLENILDNSVKYSNPGSEISLIVRKVNKDLLFTVADQGSGIRRDDLPHVFERMFKSPRGQRTGLPGAGLGLTISKGLIEAHGGKIWIESEEGIGTRCFFTLPLEDDAKSPGHKSPDTATIL